MLVLGFNGGLETVSESFFSDALEPGESLWTHDAAAALLEDRRIVLALEEERLNRLKHCAKTPWQAMRRCLQEKELSFADLDAVAYYASEKFLSPEAVALVMAQFYPGERYRPNGVRDFFRWHFKRHADVDIDPSRFVFVEHHLAHATSAFAFSGFDESLVATVDFLGEGLSATVGRAKGTSYKLLRAYTFPTESLGYFYSAFTERFLGYGPHSEYKVMGLAPYGDPFRFESIFKTFYALGCNGTFEIFPQRFSELAAVLRPRIAGEPFVQEHRDLAAIVQVSFEKMLFHILNFFARETSLKNLSLAGGCAQNSTANGKLLQDGLFENVFVQPAAHDAGCALGAAMHASFMIDTKQTWKPKRLSTARLGPSLAGRSALNDQLKNWQPLVTFKEMGDIFSIAAKRLASGQVLGWVQGRSEYGARALGGRSIVADPRPKENKERINAMIKKREAYRPFAPSVLAEYASEFFEIDNLNDAFSFMTFVVPVRSKYRQCLGAVTHVDGTARIQTVNVEHEPDYWALIDAFRKETGVPVLLNTSFNNNVEPIVDTVEDALECFLTSGLDAAAIGTFIVDRREQNLSIGLREMAVRLPPHVRLTRTPRLRQKWPAGADYYGLESTGWPAWGHGNVIPISRSLYSELRDMLPEKAVGSGLEQSGVLAELLELWNKRWVRICPPSR
jgi:carbamoyltransferase